MHIFSLFQVIRSSLHPWAVKLQSTISTLPTVTSIGGEERNLFHGNGTRSPSHLVTYFFCLRANKLREIFLKFLFSPFLVSPQLKGSGFTTSAKRVGPLNPFYHCIRISPLIAFPGQSTGIYRLSAASLELTCWMSAPSDTRWPLDVHPWLGLGFMTSAKRVGPFYHWNRISNFQVTHRTNNNIIHIVERELGEPQVLDANDADTKILNAISVFFF
jgi:hypothetical protein